MASEMTISQHTCTGLFRFILTEDTVKEDMEVMTLKGVYIFRQDKHSKEKTFIPWSENHKPPSSFLKRLKETQGKPSRDFLESVMGQNLEPNYRHRHYCTCPKVARLSDIQVIQDEQARHLEQMDNASILDSQADPLNQVGGHLIIQTGVIQIMIRTVNHGPLLLVHPDRTHNPLLLAQEQTTP